MSGASALTIDWVIVGGDPAPWRALGLVGVVDGDVTRVPMFGTGIEVDPARPPGISALALSRLDDGAQPASLDGVETVWRSRPVPQFADHPLGVRQLDHVVVTTDDLARTCGAIADGTGAALKRVRETGTLRQGFHRVGGLIVEVVESSAAATGTATGWGVVIAVDDLDGACNRLGPELIGEPRDAVQPGRRIATVRTGAGLGCAVALMTPHL